ncbi:MAG TPA: DUF6056 family protein [Anaerolineales bacterium]
MKKLLRWRRVAPELLIGFLPAALLLLIGYTGSFTRYIADDYCSVYWARRFGLFRSVWHWYITWSGRFSAYTADWFVMLMGSRNVGIIPPVMLGVWLLLTVAALHLFLRRWRNGSENWPISIALGIAFLFAVLSIIPSIQTSFYWWNGMRSYSLPLLLLTLYAVLYELGIDHLRSRRDIALAGAFTMVFFFITGGLSDVYAVVQLGLVVALGAFSLFDSHRQNGAPPALFSAGIAGTVLALAAIVLSPGNPIREASFPPHPGVLRLLAIAWQGYADLLHGILLTPAKLLALIGVVCAAGWAGARAQAPMAPRWTAAVFIALGLLLSYGAYLPGSWGLSEPPPPRNISVPVFALTVGLFAAALVGGAQISTRTGSSAAVWILLVTAVLSLNVSAGIGIQSSYAAMGNYIQYAHNWDAEEDQILAAKASGAPSVTVPSWPNWAGLDVLSEHSKNWLNQCTSGYYGIEVLGRAP